MRVSNLVVLLLASATPAYSQSAIAVNFAGGQHTTGPDIPDLLPADVAGVFVQTNWNNVARWSDTMNVSEGLPDADGTQTNLLDNLGLASTMDLSWDADNTWRSVKQVPDTGPFRNGDEQMMTGYLDVSGAQPFVTFSASEVPYSNYDLYVYVGGNGNGRFANVSLTAGALTPAQTTVWYTTLTQLDAFTGPGSYRQATGTSRDTAQPGNYVLYKNIQSSSFTVQMTRPDDAGGNSGIHGFQIVQGLAPTILEIDLGTGFATLIGGDAIPVEMVAYQIDSPAGSLLPSRLTGLTAANLDPIDNPNAANGIAGDAEGESWEVATATTTQITEAFLLGSTSFDTQRRVPLGQVYDRSFGAAANLRFSYASTAGVVIEGRVTFVNNPALPGDYNRVRSVNRTFCSAR